MTTTMRDGRMHHKGKVSVRVLTHGSAPTWSHARTQCTRDKPRETLGHPHRCRRLRWGRAPTPGGFLVLLPCVAAPAAR
jgi:hypothetical protein